MDQADKAAIEQVLHGDPDAFRHLVERYHPVAFRLAFRITGSASDAEEVTQEAFFRAYNKLATFRHDSSFSTWINRIAMNTALNLVDRRSRDATHTAASLAGDLSATRDALQIADTHAGPERLLLNHEAARLRHTAMADLTPMERTAFTLRHMEDMPIAEIATALKIPANSAKQAVFRAVSKLRHSLAPLAAGTR